MDRPFVAENAVELRRLRAVVARLSDADLKRRTGEGWTIAASLAHLAFWDFRALNLIKRWKATGICPSPVDVDGINDAMLPLCLAIPPRAAAVLAISAGEAIDRELEQASDELIAEIKALGGRFRLRRSEHRREHLDRIEDALRLLGAE